MHLKNIFFFGLISCLSIACQSEERTSKQLTIEASHALARGESSAVVEKILRQAVELEPSNDDAYAFLADQLSLQHKYGEATKIYQQLIQQTPDNPEFYEALINVLVEQNKVNEAIEVYQQGIKEVSNPSSLDQSKVTLIIVQKQVNQAIEVCQSHTVNRPWLYANLGQMLDTQNQVDAAITCYRQAVQREPDYLSYQIEVAKLLKKQNKLNEAVSIYRQVLQRPFIEQNAKSNLFIYRDLTQILFEQKDYEAVIAECQKILQIDSSDTYARRTLDSALNAQRKL